VIVGEGRLADEGLECEIRRMVLRWNPSRFRLRRM
jgi:hypothetical protein